MALAVLASYLLRQLSAFKEERSDRHSAGEENAVPEPPLAPVAGGELLFRLRLAASTLGLLARPAVLRERRRQFAGNARAAPRTVEEPGAYQHKVRYTLPFSGEWYVFNGGPDRESSHSWEVAAQRYAYDFVVAGDGLKRWREGTEGRRLGNYLCYGEAVLAPAGGVVVEVVDGIRDAPRPGTGWLGTRAGDPRGNCVVTEHAQGEYSVLAHLIPGSIGVREGAWVERGQVMGVCGSSGNSTEPHLHFHVQDRAEFFEGAGLPVAFDDAAAVDGKGTNTPQTRHYPKYLKRGEWARQVR